MRTTLDGPLSVGATTMGNDIYGSELIFSEADVLKIENQQLYLLIVQLILDLNDLEVAYGRQLSLAVIGHSNVS
jgi:hypothetical protein